jgi:uncharacterized membrane protein YkoI
MRLSLVGVAMLGVLSTARAEGPIVAQPCLSPRDMQEAVAAERVVSPARAVGAARHAVPGGDMLRANLCREGEAYIYVISVLRNDGRVVHVVVDGPTGKVAQVQ